MPVGSCTRWTSTGFVQETPASSEYDVVIAPPVTRLPSWIGSPTWYARPALSKLTQGSVARGNSSCGLPEQELNRAQAGP